MDRRDTHWRINKEIPVSTLVVLLTQTVSFIFFLAKQDTRLTLLEERRQDDKAAAVAIVQLPERMLRTELQVSTIAKSVERLEIKLDQQNADSAARGKR
ncbi:MAG TPA: hypothetical protein VN023_09595 [Methylovorus sp.]|nr:hypothetical protein [Methylovorus sp.]